MTFQEENNQLLQSYLERTFFYAWQHKEDKQFLNFRRLEIDLNAKCNLDCKYCYYAKYGDELYPSEISHSKDILNNLELLLDWLIEKGYAPDLEFFSGEPLFQKVGFDALELILKKFRNAKSKPKMIVIPTNFTFLLNEKLTNKVEELINSSKEVGIPIYLSASFDGKYCEANRPFKSGTEKRSEAYYDRCFEFGVKHHCGFHPMVYSELIEKWKQNFLWFQGKFREFGIPFNNIYLLEVRNAEWSDRQIRDYMDFLEFLINWTFKEPCNGNLTCYLDFLFKGRGYNILTNCLTSVGRGLGCSLQACLYVRLGDLALIPCHRQSYEQFILGNLLVKNGKIESIQAKNPELAIGEIAFDFKTMPQCENCLIKYLCQGQCLGAMYEVTGDFFSPIPTVCKLSHAKVLAMVNAYKKLGIYQAIFNKLNQEKQASLKLFEEVSCEKTR